MKNLRASVYIAFTWPPRGVKRVSLGLSQYGAGGRSFALQRGSPAKKCHKDPLKCSPSPVAHEMQ
jgi:hypothetical protein